MSDDRVLEHILNPSAPLSTEESKIPDRDPVPQTDQEKNADKLRLEAIKLAEQNRFPEAMKLFGDAIALAPTMASLYNDRAQLSRLVGENEMALDDINKAIQFSNSQGKTAVQAYTQRAMLHMLNKDEERARLDFERASSLGGKFAASQAAKLNPYAKLCNQMLSKAMDELQ